MAIIDKPSDYFNTILYSGTGSENARTGVNFQPDWVWIKQRNGSTNQMLTDSVRGATKTLHSQNTDAESTDAQALKSFNSDGFTVGTDTDVNGAGGTGGTYVAWNWKAGTSFTNDASSTGIGSMDSAGSVNEEAGFAIVSYTGNETASTLKHGLSTVPQMIIIKGLISARDWVVGQHTQGWTKSAYLNEANAFSNQTHLNNTAPTSSVFTIEGGSNSNVNTNNAAYISYIFSERQGYSKFGSYIGNGNADGAFVNTGFKPAFLLVKRSSQANNDWNLHNNKSPGFNVNNSYLAPNDTAAEVTGNTSQIFDLLSNGFKCRGSGTGSNGSGSTYIYMAFAENPFVASNFNAATAR